MKNKTKIFKIISLVMVLAIAIGLTIYLIPVIKDLATPERTKGISRTNQ